MLGEPPDQLEALPANHSLLDGGWPGPGNDAKRIESRSEVGGRYDDRIIPPFDREVHILVDLRFTWSIWKAVPDDIRHRFLEAELDRKQGRRRQVQCRCQLIRPVDDTREFAGLRLDDQRLRPNVHNATGFSARLV